MIMFLYLTAENSQKQQKLSTQIETFTLGDLFSGFAEGISCGLM